MSSKNLGKLQILQAASDLGYSVKTTARGHLKCSHPITGALVVLSVETEGRTLYNSLATLRRRAKVQSGNTDVVQLNKGK